jgi:hypothetical protein
MVGAASDPHMFTTRGQGLLATGSARPYIVGMVTFRTDTCDKCKNANPITVWSPKKPGRWWSSTAGGSSAPDVSMLRLRSLASGTSSRTWMA